MKSFISCDARTAHLDIDGSHLSHWGGAAPDGRLLAANNHHLTLDGEPLAIVAGEFQGQRYPRSEWREGIRALKAAGCTMVSSYWFWSLVEPSPGTFDFTGTNDLAAFARLCADEGLWLQARIGPFNNAEFLLGGLPPWLYGMPLVERSNDPRYLKLVGRYYGALAEQLDGLLWRDGGPVIVVQLENELSHAPNDWRTLFGYTATDHRGPEGAEFGRHMSALRRLAIDNGIEAPFFAMTGWGTAGELPGDEFLPTYGGYMDLHHRPGPNARLTTFEGAQDYPCRGRLPIAFSELGTGSPNRAAYRPMSPPEMMISTALTRLGGTESIFLGYYLFHGGTNPTRGDGFGWLTKENAFGLRSYDFWAPVGEFGDRRASFYRAAPLNLFVREFGTELARQQAIAVADPVVDPDDDRLRAVVRSDGGSGFVFLSNYGNNTPLSARDDVRVEVALAGGQVRFPRENRLAVPSGGWAILPVRLDLGHGYTLVSSTAQPLARLGNSLVSFAPSDLPVEYVVSGPDGDEEVLTSAGRTLTVGSSQFELITLDRGAAEHAQIVTRNGRKWLMTGPDDLTETPAGIRISRFVDLADPDRSPAGVRVLPGAARLAAELPAPRLAADDLRIERLSESRLLLRVADGRVSDPDDLWVDIAYTGDLCRAFDSRTGQLIADDFHRGIPWRVKLGRFADALAADGVQLRVEPLMASSRAREDAPMLLDSHQEVLGEARIDRIRPFARQSAIVRPIGWN
ncbi:beta-galactosidase [Kribbella sp. NPDC051137]|uniref:beta-galactosidase n=1 Tax=Kribbella sp. NPDC051137 TaxID=3155045 RepID=UPI0034390DBF